MNENGFSLIEMLVSISIVFVIAIFIVPSFMFILIERKNLVLRNEGNVLMQEQIYAYYHAPSEIKTEDEREGALYKVQLNESNICVTWENRKQEEEQIYREIFK